MTILFCFLFLLVISSASACDRCVYKTKAAYSNLSNGACGYSSMAVGFNNGLIAAAGPSLYNDGAGCGACFQVRCRNKALCRSKGTTVMLTDSYVSNSRTGFVLSTKAFKAMAKQGSEKEVLSREIVDIEYKRVPCEYKNQNLAVRVEEHSNKPYYLAIKVLYQGGQTEILAIDVAAVGSSNWQPMNHNYGAVWDTNSVPAGALKFRFAVTAGYDGKWVGTKRVLPAEWKKGVVYDTGVQITDIAKEEGCSPCDYGTWN